MARPDPTPAGTSASPPGPDLVGQIREKASFLRGFWRGVIGSDAYDRYLEHHRRHHPDEAPMSARDFWKDKYDELERNPKSRCC